MNAYQKGYTNLNSGSNTSCCRGKCPYSCQGIYEPRPDCRLRQWIFAFSVLFLLHIFYNSNTDKLNSGGDKMNYLKQNNSKQNNSKQNNSKQNNSKQNRGVLNVTRVPYKYLLTNSSEVVMTFDKRRMTAYSWFESMRNLFVNIGKDEEPTYPNGTSLCILYISKLGPISPVKAALDLYWVENQISEVKKGGFHAPSHCRSKYRVAIFVVPHQYHKRYLGVFLYYLHQVLKKQLIEYRVFVIEQLKTGQGWNKGMLYNIAYLESQRFGLWDCLIFHDVDLIPLNEKIIYGCSNNPIHMSTALEYKGYVYVKLFGGVTALTPEQYERVNGYSNLFWNLEGVDDDMRARLLSQGYIITRYNASIAIFGSLTHHQMGHKKAPFDFTTTSYLQEGFSITKYNLVNITKERLFTHIIANITGKNLHQYNRSRRLYFRNVIKYDYGVYYFLLFYN